MAIVTGAARGTGEAIARRLVDDGARVLLLDVLDEAGQQVAESLGKFFRNQVCLSEYLEALGIFLRNPVQPFGRHVVADVQRRFHGRQEPGTSDILAVGILKERFPRLPGKLFQASGRNRDILQASPNPVCSRAHQEYATRAKCSRTGRISR